MRYKTFLIPAFIAFLLASFYIVKSPGVIESDAKEYDDLAISILDGKFELAGEVSMEREPAYPLFRAILKIIKDSPGFILWVQAIIYFFSIFLIGLTMSKIDPEKGHFAAWGAALAYGLAFYPSVHISETLVAFLLALIGYNLMEGIEKHSWVYFVNIAIFSSFLLLTRYTYILVPIAAFFILLKYTKEKLKVYMGFLIILCLVTPWVVRNYKQFGEFNMAGRSGGILYARALRADASWRSLGDSYLSALVGRGILFTIYPNNQSIWLEQWGDWWRDKETIREMWGEGRIEIDRNRKEAAFDIIFKDFNTFAKFVAWTGVDELRLIQLLWFIVVIFSTWIGFKKYGLKFLPGIFLICVLLPHSIADNIARYGAPLQPWLLSGIFMTLLYPLKTHVFKRHNTSLQ